MKPNAIVVAEEVPEHSLSYFTPGKEYEAEINFKSSFWFAQVKDDDQIEGDSRFCLIKRCPHLDGKPWRIVKVMNVMEVEL